jgi:hypothetical protein
MHAAPDAQSVGATQEVAQATGPQRLGAHACVWAAAHVPAPSQLRADDSMPPLQDPAAQPVPAVY